jgi:putative DNA primase/helicase
MSRLEWARFLLARLAPHRADDVNDWLRVGGGLQEFGEDGFTLWNEWSRQSRKYPGEEEMRRRWIYLGRTRKGSDHA